MITVKPEDIAGWSAQELARWLEQNSFKGASKAVKSRNVTGEQFLGMNISQIKTDFKLDKNETKKMTPLLEELQKQDEVYNESDESFDDDDNDEVDGKRDNRYDTTILDEYPVTKNLALAPQADDADENHDYEEYENGEDYGRNERTLEPPPLVPARSSSPPIPIKTPQSRNAPPQLPNLPPSLPSSPPPNSRAPALSPPLPNPTPPLPADSQPPPLISRKQKNGVIEEQQTHKLNVFSKVIKEQCDAIEEYDALDFDDVEYEPDDLNDSPPDLPPVRPILNAAKKLASCLPPLKNNNSAKKTERKAAPGNLPARPPPSPPQNFDLEETPYEIESLAQTPKRSNQQQSDKTPPPQVSRGGFAFPVSLEDIQRFKKSAPNPKIVQQPKNPPQYTSPASKLGPNILKPVGGNTKIANGVASNPNLPPSYSSPVKTAVVPKIISKPPANFNKNTLESNGWYKKMERKEGEHFLEKSRRNGAFIVRPSTKEPGKPYTLAIYLNGSIKNIPIRKKMNKFALGITEKANEQTFDSVQDMVKHYRSNKLEVTNQDGPVIEVMLLDSM